MDFSTGKLPTQMHWKAFLGDGYKKFVKYVVIMQC